MLLQNPNWMDGLNKAKKRVNKAAKVNNNDYKIDSSKLFQKKMSKETVNEVAKNFLKALSELKLSLDKTKLYGKEETDKQKFFSNLYASTDSAMLNVLNMLESDVPTTYLFWQRPTYLRVAELFETISTSVTLIYRKLVDQGFDDPSKLFPNWIDVYNRLSAILLSYRNEGGKTINNTQKANIPSINYNIPGRLLENKKTKVNFLAPTTPKKSKTTSATPLSSKKLAKKIVGETSRVLRSRNGLTAEKAQKIRDDKAILVSLLESETETLRELEQRRAEIMAKPKGRRSEEEIKEAEQLKRKIKTTKNEVESIEGSIQEYELMLDANSDQLRQFPPIVQNLFPQGPPGTRTPTPQGTPQGTRPTTPTIPQTPQDLRDQEQTIIDILRALDEEIDSLDQNDADYQTNLQGLQQSKSENMQRLESIEQELRAVNETPQRDRGLQGLGRTHHIYDSEKASHHAWVDIFYNINPPKYVSPYNVLIPVTTIPKRYL